MQTIEVNGAVIPALGFGTWELRGRDAYRMVRAALDIGYRHIDTARMYGNEDEVGRAIADSGVARDQVFLTTKIWTDCFRDGELQRAAEDSLRRLRVDAVDLLLLHWPNPAVPLTETLGALNDVHARGWTRHIGVSNFNTRLIDAAVATSDAPLVVNQVEYHPYLNQGKVLERLRAHGMGLTAYRPIAQGKVLDDPVIQRIAERHGRNPVQVTLRWLLQQDGVSAIPRSSSERRAESNFAVSGFSLSDEEMAEIHALARPDGRMVDPADMNVSWD
ncbi:MAG: aldo/keto reductase [Candidatus Competibacterales bacterium]|nr:aldo/keto reductase [Candidatus Competibacterales bacterium]